MDFRQISLFLVLCFKIVLSSTCTVSCGGGWLAPNQNSNCKGNCKTFIPCNTQPCPKNCVLSDFSEWSLCSATCGGGIQIRTRSIIANGGSSCGPTTESRTCNTKTCATDCVMSSWSEWSECSSSCESGTQIRTRSIIVNGNECGATYEVKQCNNEMSNLTEWTTCSKSCDGGIQYRFNNVPRPSECPREQTANCNTTPCPQDCLMDSWTDWSECSKTCGSGTRERSREILIPSSYGGSPCGPTKEIEICNECSCPQDCVMTTYSEWTPCSVSCGGGVKSRTRAIKSEGAHGGEICGDTIEYEVCNTQPCSVDCVMSSWVWTGCDKSCGRGISFRTRTILVQPLHNGKPCAATKEEFVCNECPCPVDCEMSSHSEWSICSSSCGTGLSSRYRTITIEPKYGGAPCGNLTDVAICSGPPCPVDCEVGKWGVFSTCSLTCGGGTRKRSRVVITQGQNGGLECEETEQEELCNTEPCPQDCVMGSWGEWGKCDKPCGGGTQFRTRCPTVPPLNGGKECENSMESQPCNVQNCPKDCLVTIWSQWSPCSKTCGPGTKERTRKVRSPAEDGGNCVPLTETSECIIKECPIDCVLSTWTPLSNCDKSCGGGVSKRTREILVVPNEYGIKCGVTLESVICNTEPCPVDCKMSSWSDWSQCDKTCNGGLKVRTRSIEVNSQSNGRSCDDEYSEEIEPCNTDPCPVDCRECNWGSWTQCDKTCGSGTQVRTKCIHVYPRFGGKECGPTLETQYCNTNNCPLDCTFSKWTNWTTCDKTCGGGTQIRTRNTTKPEYGGQPCIGSTTESRKCNNNLCPVDCVLSTWSSYSTCDKSCGKGKRYRTRNVVTQSKDGGKPCGTTYESIACNTNACSNIVPST